MVRLPPIVYSVVRSPSAVRTIRAVTRRWPSREPILDPRRVGFEVRRPRSVSLIGGFLFFVAILVFELVEQDLGPIESGACHFELVATEVTVDAAVVDRTP